MQIVIPMSGIGKRFLNAGFKMPKPLILVENKPIIQHVVEMFDPDDEFIFICNKDHLNSKSFNMREVLENICLNSKIIEIDPHKKGPIYAVLMAKNEIDFSKETIVNYCDFSCYWDYSDFKNFIKKNECDGAIPCYRGFHPHTLWSNYYAYFQTESNQDVINIQEKQPFTSNPTSEFASSGTYYFKTAKLMIDSFEETINNNLSVGEEYYVSLSYIPLLKKNYRIKVYQIDYFMQWGTPEDLRDYKYWSNIFHNINKHKKINMGGILLMPMAGLSERFKNEGYEIPKPLIQVSGKNMAIQAINDLPKTEQTIVAYRRDMDFAVELVKQIKNFYIDTKFYELKNNSDGQADTCLKALNSVQLDFNSRLTISPCDNGMIYDSDKLKDSIAQDFDIIIWTSRGYPGAIRSPQMYGWVNEKGNNIDKVSVKKPLQNPDIDPIITGTFTFKSAKLFIELANLLIQEKHKINNEYYVDSIINLAIDLGYSCKTFEIDHYICWGTPNDLKTFEYWQKCFDKWQSHDYQISKDRYFN